MKISQILLGIASLTLLACSVSGGGGSTPAAPPAATPPPSSPTAQQNAPAPSSTAPATPAAAAVADPIDGSACPQSTINDDQSAQSCMNALLTDPPQTTQAQLQTQAAACQQLETTFNTNHPNVWCTYGSGDSQGVICNATNNTALQSKCLTSGSSTITITPTGN